jgi:hypothetical protein
MWLRQLAFHIVGRTQVKGILKHNQRDATLYNIRYCCQCSTCFGRFFRSSSGAQKLYMQLRYLSNLCIVTASLVDFRLN